MNVYHIYPISDLKEHNIYLEEECDCKPEQKYFDNCDDDEELFEFFPCILIIHNSWDLREAREKIFGEKIEIKFENKND